MKQTGRKTGTPKTGGRKKGSPNVLTTDVKRELLEAFHELGGKDFLLKLAEENPQLVTPLLAKCIPNEQQVNVSHEVDLGAAMREAEKRLAAFQENMRDITPPIKTIEHEEPAPKSKKWPGYD